MCAKPPCVNVGCVSQSGFPLRGLDIKASGAARDLASVSSRHHLCWDGISRSIGSAARVAGREIERERERERNKQIFKTR